jgi:pyrroloquinoline-quinone synthase
MRTAAALHLLDELIRNRSILQHHFYLRWQQGTLLPHDLTVYAAVYYPHVAAFPDYLRNAIAAGGNSSVTATLRQNLHEELTTPAPHPELWLDFAEAVGADRDQVRQAEPSSHAAETVKTFHRLTRAHVGSALAALYAYESQQPAVAEQKLHGLRNYYDLKSDRGLCYFRVHAEADVEHSRAERDGLAVVMERGGSSFEEVVSATSQALDAYWNLLDAVCLELEQTSTN